MNEHILEGNRELIELGGMPYQITDIKLYDIVMSTPKEEVVDKVSYGQMDISAFLKQ